MYVCTIHTPYMIHGTVHTYIYAARLARIYLLAARNPFPPKKKTPRPESLQGGGGEGIGIAYSVHVLYLHKLSYFILFGLSDEKEKKG